VKYKKYEADFVFLPRKNPDAADCCRQPSNSRLQATDGSVVLMSLADGRFMLHARSDIAVPTCASGGEVIV